MPSAGLNNFREMMSTPDHDSSRDHTSSDDFDSDAFVSEEEAIPEFQNGEIVRFTDCLNMESSQLELPKAANGAEVSLTWYKNWVINWSNQTAEEAFNRLHELDVAQTLANQSFLHKAAEKFGDVVQLVQTYCQDWEDGPLDIITFFFCLAAFSNPQYHISNTPVYDDRLLLDAYHVSHYAFASYAGSRSLVFKRLPFMKHKNFIDGCWDKAILGPSPAWFIAIDDDKEVVFLSLRGTKRLDDILVDLSAQYIPWRGGYAHRGFIRALSALEKQVTEKISNTMNNHPTYQLRICGHSMGAAVSALLTLQWYKEHPEWKVQGFGFATPCCISKHLVEESKTVFTTFVHHFDAVSRLSMGSIQDMHNGMRLFSKKVGRSSNAVALYHAMKKLTIKAENKSVLEAASEISQIINGKLKEEWAEAETTSHLYPAGNIYQFWRENRGKQFTTFKMYQTETQQYGRLEFSPTMLSDHGTVGYKAAFESLLAISVVETKIWISMSSLKRERIREYWNSWPKEDIFDPDADISFALKQLDRQSKYKKRAYEMGMIRPFLLLVSLSPQRRAAVANLMGISLVGQYWYCLFDPHKEAWKMITGRRGFTSRANGVFRTMNPLSEHVTWYDIIHICCKLVKQAQKEHINPRLLEMLKGRSKSHAKALKASQKVNCTAVSELEEIFMLLLFSLSENLGTTATDPLAKAFVKANKLIENSPITPVSIDSLIDESTPESPRTSYSSMRSDNEILSMMIQLRNVGFVTDLFLKCIAKQQLDKSFQQKANEFYTWGSTIRKKDDRIKKRHVVGVVGLSLASAALFLSIIPLIHIAPPLAVIPATASVGIGMYCYNKSTPGGLLSMTVALLQQRIALAHHGVDIKSYYF